MVTEFKVPGGPTLPVFDCPPEFQEFVPGDNGYEPQGDEVAVLGWGLALHRPVLFSGPAGSGKDACVEWMAHKLNRPKLTISMAEGTGLDQIIGTPVPVTGENGIAVEFREGALPRAIRMGAILDMQEGNMADERVLARLNDFLANGEKLSVWENPDAQGKMVEPRHPDGTHNGFGMVWTINPAESGMYAGAKVLNSALLNRFLVHHMDYLGIVLPDKEASVIARATGIKLGRARRIVEVMNTVRQRTRMDEKTLKTAGGGSPIYAVPSTRSAIKIGELVFGGAPVMQAFEWAFLNECNPDDRPVLHKLALDMFAADPAGESNE